MSISRSLNNQLKQPVVFKYADLSLVISKLLEDERNNEVSSRHLQLVIDLLWLCATDLKPAIAIIPLLKTRSADDDRTLAEVMENDASDKVLTNYYEFIKYLKVNKKISSNMLFEAVLTPTMGHPKIILFLMPTMINGREMADRIAKNLLALPKPQFRDEKEFYFLTACFIDTIVELRKYLPPYRILELLAIRKNRWEDPLSREYKPNKYLRNFIRVLTKISELNFTLDLLNKRSLARAIILTQSADLLEEALDPEKNLGKFFMKRRGLSKPTAEKGALKKLTTALAQLPAGPDHYHEHDNIFHDWEKITSIAFLEVSMQQQIDTELGVENIFNGTDFFYKNVIVILQCQRIIGTPERLGYISSIFQAENIKIAAAARLRVKLAIDIFELTAALYQNGYSAETLLAYFRNRPISALLMTPPALPYTGREFLRKLLEKPHQINLVLDFLLTVTERDSVLSPALLDLIKDLIKCNPPQEKLAPLLRDLYNRHNSDETLLLYMTACIVGQPFTAQVLERKDGLRRFILAMPNGPEKINCLQTAVDPMSSLGGLFWMPRGVTKTSIKHGSLRILNEELIKLTRGHQNAPQRLFAAMPVGSVVTEEKEQKSGYVLNYQRP